MKFNGKKVKIKRIELGLNQKNLAEECKISMGTISGIEKHSKLPNLKVILKLIEVLKVPFDYFFN